MFHCIKIVLTNCVQIKLKALWPEAQSCLERYAENDNHVMFNICIIQSPSYYVYNNNNSVSIKHKLRILLLTRTTKLIPFWGKKYFQAAVRAHNRVEKYLWCCGGVASTLKRSELAFWPP